MIPGSVQAAPTSGSFWGQPISVFTSQAVERFAFPCRHSRLLKDRIPRKPPERSQISGALLGPKGGGRRLVGDSFSWFFLKEMVGYALDMHWICLFWLVGAFVTPTIPWQKKPCERRGHPSEMILHLPSSC